jgi:hypothetical protein
VQVLLELYLCFWREDQSMLCVLHRRVRYARVCYDSEVDGIIVVEDWLCRILVKTDVLFHVSASKAEQLHIVTSSLHRSQTAQACLVCAFLLFSSDPSLPFPSHPSCFPFHVHGVFCFHHSSFIVHRSSIFLNLLLSSLVSHHPRAAIAIVQIMSELDHAMRHRIVGAHSVHTICTAPRYRFDAHGAPRTPHYFNCCGVSGGVVGIHHRQAGCRYHLRLGLRGEVR